MNFTIINERKKWILLVFIPLVVFGIFIVYMKYYNSDNLYFTVVSRNLKVEKNEPVFADNTLIGKVITATALISDPSKVLLTLSIDKSINIPFKSYVESKDDKNANESGLSVRLIASSGFYKKNDTIPFIKIESEPVVSKFIAVEKPDTISVNSMAEKKVPDVISETNHAEIGFFVQILTSNIKLPVDSKKFKELKNVKMYVEKGLFKYYVGRNLTLDQSVQLCEKMKSAGFTDAFVIALKGHERITVNKALQLLKN